MSSVITVRQTIAGCTTIRVLSGPLQTRVHTRIPIIAMLEAILQETVINEGPNHHQDILLRRFSPDQVHSEVQEAILLHPEAAWKDQVVIQVLLPAAAADPHHHIAADLPVEVLTPQVLPPQVLLRALHQVVALHPAAVEDTRSLKQLNSVNTYHSK